MIGFLSEFLAQLVPIPLGIILMLAIRSFKKSRGRVRIFSDSESRILALENKSEDGTGDGSDFFSKIAYDELIKNGVYVDPSNTRELRRTAFERLGLIEEMELKRLGSYLRQHPADEIRVLTRDPEVLMRRLLSFEGNSGLLLSYLINYRLGMIGVSDGVDRES